MRCGVWPIWINCKVGDVYESSVDYDDYFQDAVGAYLLYQITSLCEFEFSEKCCWDFVGSKARPCNNADEKFTVAGTGFGYGLMEVLLGDFVQIDSEGSWMGTLGMRELLLNERPGFRSIAPDSGKQTPVSRHTVAVNLLLLVPTFNMTRV